VRAVSWYFDMETSECLAFDYNGCGGNENRFESVSECWSKCKFADQGSCAGMRPPAKTNKGDTIICYRGGTSSEKCPLGYQCTMLAFFGICCHTQTQELYKRNYHPRCENGMVPHSIVSGGVPMTLIGKTCDDAFCPRETSCHMKEVFAHCCTK